MLNISHSQGILFLSSLISDRAARVVHRHVDFISATVGRGEKSTKIVYSSTKYSGTVT